MGSAFIMNKMHWAVKSLLDSSKRSCLYPWLFRDVLAGFLIVSAVLFFYNHVVILPAICTSFLTISFPQQAGSAWDTSGACIWVTGTLSLDAGVSGNGVHILARQAWEVYLFPI